MIIKADELKGTTVHEIMSELRNNEELMDELRGHNVPIGDKMEAIASHIYYTDEDYDTDLQGAAQSDPIQSLMLAVEHFRCRRDLYFSSL